MDTPKKTKTWVQDQGGHFAILRPSLSYHLSLRPLFCLFLRGFYAIKYRYNYLSTLHWK